MYADSWNLQFYNELWWTLQESESNFAISHIAAGQRVVSKTLTSAAGQWQRWLAACGNIPTWSLSKVQFCWSHLKPYFLGSNDSTNSISSAVFAQLTDCAQQTDTQLNRPSCMSASMHAVHAIRPHHIDLMVVFRVWRCLDLWATIRSHATARRRGYAVPRSACRHCHRNTRRPPSNVKPIRQRAAHLTPSQASTSATAVCRPIVRHARVWTKTVVWAYINGIYKTLVGGLAVEYSWRSPSTTDVIDNKTWHCTILFLVSLTTEYTVSTA